MVFVHVYVYYKNKNLRKYRKFATEFRFWGESYLQVTIFVREEYARVEIEIESAVNKAVKKFEGRVIGATEGTATKKKLTGK